MKNKAVKKVHRLQDVLFSIGMLALGLLFTLVFPSWNWLGFSLLFIAVFMLPFYRTGYVIDSQKGVFLKEEILLPYECKEQIADYIEGKADNLDIDPFNKGGLLLEWYFQKDRSRQFGQTFAYDDGGIYTAQSKLSELSDSQIDELLKWQS